MKATLEELEQKREALKSEITALGDFRPGTISANYRKCGKDNCACAKANHPGHGPQYLWNATIHGKSAAENIRLGPHLEKVRGEVEAYRTFRSLCDEVTEVNHAICKLRPIREIKSPDELSSLKKKLQRIFVRKFKRKQNI